MEELLRQKVHGGSAGGRRGHRQRRQQIQSTEHAGMEFQEACGEGGMLLVAINVGNSWHLAG